MTMNATLQRNAAARAANDNDGLAIFGCLLVFVALVVLFNNI